MLFQLFLLVLMNTGQPPSRLDASRVPSLRKRSSVLVLPLGIWLSSPLLLEQHAQTIFDPV